MFLEPRYTMRNNRILNRFLGRRPRQAVAVLLVMALLLGGLLWNQMSGARAASLGLIDSDFEATDGANWTSYGVNNASVDVASVVYNHTTGGTLSGRLETETVGASVYSTAGIKRAFTTPQGPLENIALSLFYRNNDVDSLNLKWEITNFDETVIINSGTITSNASATEWTQFQVASITDLLPSYNYVLRLYAQGTTLDQEEAAMEVHWDDVVLTAQYTASPATVNITTSRSSIPNNNLPATTVTATVYDQNGQVISGQEVVFSKDQIWGTFSDDRVDTDENGKASVEFQSDTGGVVEITGTAGSKSDSADITVLYPASITVSSSLARIPDNNKTTANITAHVRDQNGQPLQGVRVDFLRAPLSGTLSADFDSTDANGNAHVTFKSDIGATFEITAKSNQNPSTSISSETNVVVQKPKTLTVTVDKASIPNDNAALVTVTAHLTDESGKDMNGETINFEQSPSDGTLSATSAVTRSNGTAQVTFKSAVGATYTITGTVFRNPAIDPPVADSAAVKVIAPTTLVLDVSRNVIPSNNKTTSTITATLRDQDGGVIKGEAIDFSTNIGTFTSTGTSAASGVTDINGQIAVPVKSATSGLASVMGTVRRTPTVTGSKSITVEDPTPTTVMLDASNLSIPDDNSTKTSVTATVYDQNGYTMSGQTVTFTAASGSFEPDANATTDENGKASVQFKSGTAGTVTVTGTCGTKSDNIDVGVIARVPNALTLIASTAAIPDDGTSTTTITAHLLDQFGKPFNNQTVTFSKNHTWGTLSSATALTNSNGDAVITFKSASVGTIMITGTASGSSDQQTITVQQRLPSTLMLAAVPPSVLADGVTESVITANLKDQFGMPLSGKQVNFSTGLGTLSSIVGTTDVGGNVTVKIKSNKPGAAVVGAKVSSIVPVEGIVSVEFRSTDFTSPTLESVEPTSKQVFYLTFSENIKFSTDPPTGWTLKKYVGEAVYEVPFETPVILSGDRRVVRITLQGVNSMDTGNQYPNPVRYEIGISGVTDTAGNNLNPPSTVKSFDAFTPHGKYASYPVAAGNSTRICAQCHSNHKAVGNKLLTGTSIKKVCFVCHGSTGMSTFKVEAEFYRAESGGYSPSMHKALDSDSPGYDNMTCVDCHNPHGNRRSGTNDILPKLLQTRNANGTIFTSADGNLFCLACHGSADVNPIYGNRFGSYWDDTIGDHSGGMNVVENVYNSAHYDNKLDSLQTSSGTNITCNKCHERHGSAATGLVDNSVAGFTSERLCYKCHDTTQNSMNNVDIKQKFEADSGANSKHNITDPEAIGLSCRSCHEPHSNAARSYADSGAALPADISDPSNTRNNWNKSSGSMSEFCIKCHDTDSGVTVAKIKSATEFVPFTVKLREIVFANGTGWNKSLYTSSGHYSKEIDCIRCHDQHGSEYNRLNLYPEDPSGAPTQTSGMCLRCHGGGASPAGPAIYEDQLAAEFGHPTLSVTGKHSDTEKYSQISAANRHAECADCHDPHTVKSAGTSQTDKLGKVSGVKFSQEPWSSWSSSSSAQTIMNSDSSSREAYVCYKCHSKFSYNTTPPETPSSVGSWQGAFNQTDVAKEFNPANPARHVVEGNSQMPAFTVDDESYDYGKFKNNWNATSSMKCTDCHGPSVGTSTGPHGSGNRYILKDTWDNTTGQEGTSNHLCFNCHDYNFYTGNDQNDPGSFNVRSQFSAEGTYNLHGGSHQGKSCVKCHGAVTHGWNKIDSDGGGLSLFITSDPQPYQDGVAISSIDAANNTPGNWVKATCVTSCHTDS